MPRPRPSFVARWGVWVALLGAVGGGYVGTTAWIPVGVKVCGGSEEVGVGVLVVVVRIVVTSEDGSELCTTSNLFWWLCEVVEDEEVVLACEDVVVVVLARVHLEVGLSTVFTLTRLINDVVSSLPSSALSQLQLLATPFFSRASSQLQEPPTLPLDAGAVVAADAPPFWCSCFLMAGCCDCSVCESHYSPLALAQPR